MKCKGRGVFCGHVVTDRSRIAIFDEHQSSAALFSMSKMHDFVASLAGFGGEQGDGQQAYTHALMPTGTDGAGGIGDSTSKDVWEF